MSAGKSGPSCPSSRRNNHFLILRIRQGEVASDNQRGYPCSGGVPVVSLRCSGGSGFESEFQCERAFEKSDYTRRCGESWKGRSPVFPEGKGGARCSRRERAEFGVPGGKGRSPVFPEGKGGVWGSRRERAEFGVPGGKGRKHPNEGINPAWSGSGTTVRTQPHPG